MPWWSIWGRTRYDYIRTFLYGGSENFGCFSSRFAPSKSSRYVDYSDDDRRGRSYRQSIAPSCHAVRVPTPDVSIIDIVLELKEKGVTAEDVNATLKKAAGGAYKGIITTNEDELVSVDYRGNEHTAIIDTPLTLTMDGGMVKIVAWYDNEWGYARRIVDMVRFLAGQKPF